MALDLCWDQLNDLDAIDVNENIICTYGSMENTRLVLDIGSALVSIDKNELIGVASWYEQGNTIIYNRIRSYLPWIESVINQS